jgi:hypothetical protein
MAINLTRIKAVHPWPCGARLIGDERTALLIELHQWSYHHLRHLKVTAGLHKASSYLDMGFAGEWV